MSRTVERYTWGVVFALLIVFAVPWFMWGDTTVLAALPVWLWWHIGWMGLASLVFWLFSRRAWGLWIEGAS